MTSKVAGTPQLSLGTAGALLICMFLMLHHYIVGCHVYPLLILELIGYKHLHLAHILKLTCQNYDILRALSLLIYSE